MKTYIRYSDIPQGALYLGSENPDGTMYEELADDVADAINPVQLIDVHGVAYFDLGA